MAAPRELTLPAALAVTCGYMRQNIIEEQSGEFLPRQPGGPGPP
jgi:hypothetical protein